MLQTLTVINSTQEATRDAGSSLPLPAWPKRIADVLMRLNVLTWANLSDYSSHELLSNHGFSRRALRFVEHQLAGQRLALHGERPPREDYRVKAPSSPAVVGVYFLRCEQLVKIGHASNIRKRIADLTVAIPFDVHLMAIAPLASRREALSFERDLHARVQSLRRRGEWFQLESPLTDLIDSLRRPSS